MPLSPPPDHTKAVLAIAIGVACALSLFTLTRSNLPHVGDNIHHLPHGGLYRDGTKCITYGAPARKWPASNLFNSGNFPALAVVLALSAIIVYRSSGVNRICQHCEHSH